MEKHVDKPLKLNLSKILWYDAEYDHSARQVETGQDKLPSVSDEV